jgi:predicted nucleic acid-binding protein
MRKGKTGPRYFYDTYALVEVFKGNPNYAGFVIEKDGVTSRFNLMEFYRFLIKVSGKKDADRYFDALLPFTVEFEDDDIKEAVLFKEKNQTLSYIDCLGYVMARRLGLKFLTGDKEFSGYGNVVFVK